jgi:hypothetical protein
MSTRESVRRSPLAGAWYPDDVNGLRGMLDGFLANVPTQTLPGELCALIAPHAGYRFAGQTAAHIYQQIVGQTYEVVVVLGPSHFFDVGAYAITGDDTYETPLGQVALNQMVIETLIQRLPMRRVREPWTRWGDAQWEHSIEMQLPFLQCVLPSFSLVPILMSADELAPCLQLGHALADVMRERRCLLIASSDLNHIASYTTVQQYDADVIAAIERFDVSHMAEILLNPTYSVCGRAPILTAAIAAQSLGATRAQILHHTTSGDVTGRTQAGQYTVGYLSAAFVK